MRRRLYHDEDYGNDYTNPQADAGTREWRRLAQARAEQCLRFQAKAFTTESCQTCGGPRWAHRDAAFQKVS